MEHRDSKFREFDGMLDDAKMGKLDAVLISHPEVLGDNYEELIENLSRIAEAGLLLGIAGRQGADLTKRS